MILFSEVEDDKLIFKFRQADSRWLFNFASAHAATLNFILFCKGYNWAVKVNKYEYLVAKYVSFA